VEDRLTFNPNANFSHYSYVGSGFEIPGSTSGGQAQTYFQEYQSGQAAVSVHSARTLQQGDPAQNGLNGGQLAYQSESGPSRLRTVPPSWPTGYFSSNHQGFAGNSHYTGHPNPLELTAHPLSSQPAPSSPASAPVAFQLAQAFQPFPLASLPNTYDLGIEPQPATWSAESNGQIMSASYAAGPAAESFTPVPDMSKFSVPPQSFGGYVPVAAPFTLLSQREGNTGERSPQNQCSHPTDEISARDVWTVRGAS
jgi:hypothetical protein